MPTMTAMKSIAFEQLVMTLVRLRPESDGWQEHVCDAVLGLVGEASSVSLWCETWEESAGPPSPEDAIAALWAFEVYRAWAYYQLDLRPQFVRTGRVPYASARAAVADLASHAGAVARLVRAWVFNGGWLDARLEHALSGIEGARTALYQRLRLDECLVQAEAIRRMPARVTPPGVPHQALHQMHRSDPLGGPVVTH